jgi:hypothetical protein
VDPRWTTAGLPQAFTGVRWEIGPGLKQLVLIRSKVHAKGLARRVLIRTIDGSDLANPNFMRKVEDHV